MKKDKIYSNLREVENVFLVQVCEGKGTDEFPYQIISYIIHKDGSILGKLDRDWLEIKAIK